MISLYDKAKQADILEIAQAARLKVKKQGGKHFVCCPLHEDKTPSCLLNIGGKYANTFHCFSCNEGGSVIDFYSILHRVETKEAAKILAGGISIYADFQPIKKEVKPPERIDIHSSIYTDFQTFCKAHKPTKQKRNVFAYLQGRGLDRAAIESNNLFAIPDNKAAFDFLMTRQAEAQAAGLLSIGNNGLYFAFYKHPLIIPSISPEGKIIAFQGRRIIKEIKPKYRYLGGVSKYPFGLHTLDKKGAVLICEGVFDAIALTAAQSSPAISLGGVAIPSLLPPLIRGRNIALCLDNDRAGNDAFERLKDTLQAAGLKNIFKAELINKNHKDAGEAFTETNEAKLALMQAKNKNLKAFIDTFRLTIE